MYQNIITDPEPIELKIDAMTSPTHFIYVYIQKSIWYELRYSIQSVQKFFKGGAKVFVVGDDPKIKGITYIPVKRIMPRDVEGTHYRSNDAHYKLNVIANTKEINEEFVYMYDDTFILKPITMDAFKRYSYGLVSFEYLTEQRYGLNYKDLMKKTVDLLKPPAYNYDTHLPHVFHKSKVKKLIKKYNLLETQCLFNTLYHNEYYNKPDVILDDSQQILARATGPHTAIGLQNLCDGKIFLNYHNMALNEELKKFIKDKIAGVKPPRNRFGY